MFDRVEQIFHIVADPSLLQEQMQMPLKHCSVRIEHHLLLRRHDFGQRKCVGLIFEPRSQFWIRPCQLYVFDARHQKFSLVFIDVLQIEEKKKIKKTSLVNAFVAKLTKMSLLNLLARTLGLLKESSSNYEINWRLRHRTYIHIYVYTQHHKHLSLDT